MKQELLVKQLKKDVEVCTFSIFTYLLGTRLNVPTMQMTVKYGFNCSLIRTRNRWLFINC